MIPRLYIYAGAALAVILALGFAKVTHDKSERLRGRLEAAEQQGDLGKRSAVDSAARAQRETNIHQQANEATHATKIAPDSSLALSDDMRSALADGLRRTNPAGSGISSARP